MTELVIQTINTTSEYYPKTLELRDIVLRQPLGMSIQDDTLEGEHEAIHICALYNEQVVGVLLLKTINEHTLQMKQVAVDESLRGQSVGRKMVEFAEQTALELGFTTIMLHARQVAVPFYEKMNYIGYDEPFTEVGIPHRKMKKHLERSGQ